MPAKQLGVLFIEVKRRIQSRITGSTWNVQYTSYNLMEKNTLSRQSSVPSCQWALPNKLRQLFGDGCSSSWSPAPFEYLAPSTPSSWEFEPIPHNQQRLERDVGTARELSRLVTSTMTLQTVVRMLRSSMISLWFLWRSGIRTLGRSIFVHCSSYYMSEVMRVSIPGSCTGWFSNQTQAHLGQRDPPRPQIVAQEFSPIPRSKWHGIRL